MCVQMTRKASAVPTPFRGLRVLLVDNDTTSLLHIASVLEDYSYRVTTTELATVALSILQERTDSFDLVIADFNMPEIDCFKFIERVKFLDDFPIILMSTELKKDIIEEAMAKGACFFHKKPISTKKLKNVWQHVYRTGNHKNRKDGNIEIKSNGDEEVMEPEKEQVGDNDLDDINNGETGGPGDSKRKRAEVDDQRPSTFTHDSEEGNPKHGTKMKGKEKVTLEKKTPDLHLNFSKIVKETREREAGHKRVIDTTNLTQIQISTYLQNSSVQPPTTELTRKTSQPAAQPKMLRRSPNYNSSSPSGVVNLGTVVKEHGSEDRLSQKSSNGVENVLNQTSFTSLGDTVVTDVRPKLPLELIEFKKFTDSMDSFYRLNQKQLYSMDAKRVKIDETTKDPVEHKVQVTGSDTDHQ